MTISLLVRFGGNFTQRKDFIILIMYEQQKLYPSKTLLRKILKFHKKTYFSVVYRRNLCQLYPEWVAPT